MKSVLVTGGCGFIGSNFVEYLAVKDEYHIVVLDKLTYAGNLKNLEAVDNLKYTFINGDICNKKLLNELFEKYSEKYPDLVRINSSFALVRAT